jgi:hypothetical protein
VEISTSLRNLTTLDLKISTGVDAEQEDYDPKLFECADALEDGDLAFFIRSLPNLRILCIETDLYDDKELDFGTTLEDILHPDGHWLHLYQLSLGLIEIHTIDHVKSSSTSIIKP